MTVAGSDSCGGAGIQADLRTFAAEGVWGAAAVTAVTAQNTRGVQAVEAMPTEVVVGQIRSVLSDVAVAAVKTGMLCSGDTVRAVGEELESAEIACLVVDPVIRSTSGAVLLDEPGVDALVHRLIPMCTVVTPNIEEAEILARRSISTRSDMVRAALEISRMGAPSVLLKGGHLEDEDCPDLLLVKGRPWWIEGARVAGPGAHGTGCVLSASLAARLALGATVEDSARHAKRVVGAALSRSIEIGGGARVLWPQGDPAGGAARSVKANGWPS
jgi:hydroxymethylpyrimidine/phosphomethylpyrimidine kinase